ncbi:MAG: DUF5681 domain-containing protein [Candidatus Gastranaerophilales bacterium]|nr:DUF5681 domain-containing protein [Candidatus Gastranaerophilales bacterium]
MNKDYEIGYGKPPKDAQFKPGFSGNRKGRPKGSKNTYTLLNNILNQKITVKENNENIKISKKIAMLTQLVNKGVKGDIKAISTLLPHMLMADIKEDDREKVLSSLNHDDKTIIQMYLSNFDGVKEINDSTAD